MSIEERTYTSAAGVRSSPRVPEKQRCIVINEYNYLAYVNAPLLSFMSPQRKRRSYFSGAGAGAVPGAGLVVAGASWVKSTTLSSSDFLTSVAVIESTVEMFAV